MPENEFSRCLVAKQKNNEMSNGSAFLADDEQKKMIRIGMGTFRGGRKDMVSKTAIVFDDEDIWCDLYTRIFKRNRINLKTYSSPKNYFCQKGGYDFCPVDTPCTDFLVTDHRMPDMTGLEFLRNIRRMQCKIPDSCKAITSGSWTEEEYEEAKQLCSHVFEKSEAKEQISLWLTESPHFKDFREAKSTSD